MITVIDLKLGNIHSVCNAIRYLGYQYVLTDDPEAVSQASALILPGVGSFREAAGRLLQTGLRECIRSEVLSNHKPIMGICLGMQLLADEGEEGGGTKGLSLVRARVSRLPVNTQEHRLPHIGWNDVCNHGISIFDGIIDHSCFYFVHSYAMELNESCPHAICNYGVDFIAAFQKGHIVGTQFHPEKSREKGLILLKNFIEMI